MSCEEVHREKTVSLTDNEPTGGTIARDTLQEISLSPKDLSPYQVFEQQYLPNSSNVTRFESVDDLSKSSADVIYEGGLEDRGDIEYKVFDDPCSDDVFVSDGNDVEINANGTTYKIPFAIECHLCREMMNLCMRRTRYRGKSREYPAYRCNRKGCQTFRSIRKVFSNCVRDSKQPGNLPPKMIYQPPAEPPRAERRPLGSRGEFSEDDSDDFIVQRVHLPKQNKFKPNQVTKPMSVAEKMRKANQERANVFHEFADQLRRDIAANKRIKTKKMSNEQEEHQGTLFYISKELNPQEIIELQDAIIKQLITLRKVPPPMTMYDLPLFANCPYSKKELEAGLAESQDDFWIAFTNSPQPPLPKGFIRKRDDTLIYINPKPYDVPEILQANTPEKQADDVLSYHRRKEEQDARRTERRNVEKRYRSWASLKREFDMAENDDFPNSKVPRPCYSDFAIPPIVHGKPPTRDVTFAELMNKIGDSNGQTSYKISSGNSSSSYDSMQWMESSKSSESLEMNLDKKDQNDKREESRLDDELFGHDKLFKQRSLNEMIRSLSTPPGRVPGSPMLKSFATFDPSSKNLIHPTSPTFFSDSTTFNSSVNVFNPAFYSLSPYLQPYPTAPIDPSDDHFNTVGASEIVRTEPAFTYVHPESGVRFTDPSAFLTTFIPSPITRMAPMSFSEETTRPRRSSEPSTPSPYQFNEPSEKGNEEKVEEKEIDTFLKCTA